MKKIISFKKELEFSSMIGEVTAISLDDNLKFVDESNITGEFTVSGKYKLTEASRIEDDFSFKIPAEIILNEKLDLKTAKIEIADFYYEIENDDIMICHVDLDIEGLEVVDFCDDLFEDRECDGDKNKEVEIPKKEVIEPPVEEERHDEEEIEELIEDKKEDINIMNFDDENETYGTFVVYIVRQNETVNSILEKYNTTIEELEKYNDLKNINIGTKLIIPILKDKDNDK